MKELQELENEIFSKIENTNNIIIGVQTASLFQSFYNFKSSFNLEEKELTLDYFGTLERGNIVCKVYIDKYLKYSDVIDVDNEIMYIIPKYLLDVLL